MDLLAPSLCSWCLCTHLALCFKTWHSTAFNRFDNMKDEKKKFWNTIEDGFVGIPKRII